MQYVRLNYKIIIFSDVNDLYYPKNYDNWYECNTVKTYNGWNGMGEDLQWGKVCNGFSVPLQIFRGEGLQWGEGLQYNTGTIYGPKSLIWDILNPT